jgi:hypothetical protein
MISYQLGVLSVLGLAVSGGCIAGSGEPAPARTSTDHGQSTIAPGIPRDVLAERARIAASGRYRAQRTPPGAAPQRPGPALATDDPCPTMWWTDALDIPEELVHEADLEASEQSAAVRSNLGVITPLRGSCFVLLSTGIANHGLRGSRNPEPGTDIDPAGTAGGDWVTLRVRLSVPAGANLMTFQYNFLSAEFPEFRGTDFNDRFSLVITDNPSGDEITLNRSGVRSFEVASVNSSDFVEVSQSRAQGTGFDLFTPDPAGVDEDFPGGRPDAGMTDFHVFSAGVTGGAEVQLQFTIQDSGDGLLDSAVLIDAVDFSAL